MEDERDLSSSRYWCHACSQIMEPILEVETIKCSLCHGEFVEEMESIQNDHRNHHLHQDHESEFGGGADSDRALSLWAPILLGMMSNPGRRHRLRQLEFDDDDDNNDEGHRHDHNESDRHLYRHLHREGETELDRELELIIRRRRRRRRSSATILQLLQDIRAGMLSESDGNSDSDNRDRDRDNGGENRDQDRERVILINPFNQTIIVQGGGGGNPFESNNDGQNPIGSLGDYFVGPGLELLLQHLAENDPNRYGTPPAKKEAVEALPTVDVEENCVTTQCSVCLDDFLIGAEAKEMPCKHMFHSGCILPWLELHSSCPVCRYQLPSDESKLDRDREGSRSGIINNRTGGGETEDGNGEEEDEEREGRTGGRFSVSSLPTPFSSLFSSSGSQTANANSTSSSSSGPLTNAPESEGASRTEDSY